MGQVIVMPNRVIKVATTDRNPQHGDRETVVDLPGRVVDLDVFKVLTETNTLRDATRLEVQNSGIEEDIRDNGRVRGE